MGVTRAVRLWQHVCPGASPPSQPSPTRGEGADNLLIDDLLPETYPRKLAGEGAPLNWRPSADAVAGNGWDGGRSTGWTRYRPAPPPSPSPILGGGKRRTGAELENCMTLGDHNRCRQMVAVFEDETRLLAVFRRFQIFSAARSGTISSLVQKSQ